MSLTDSRPRGVTDGSATSVACVEVGASSCQSTIIDADVLQRREGVDVPAGRPLLLAVPGLIAGGRVIAASNLDWYDVDPVEALGLSGKAALLLGDAEAAALGEYALRGATTDLVYVGLGTGVGGAVVRDGVVVDNLLGHLSGFGTMQCRCTQIGCLETVAGGWALPQPLTDEQLHSVARAVAKAIDAEPQADAAVVVVAGGITRRYPALVELIAADLPERRVEATAAPADAKSASAWGLLHAYNRAR